MTVEIDLPEGADTAYDQLLSHLREQSDGDFSKADHATEVLQNYVASEYANLPPEEQTVALASIINPDDQE